MSLIDYTLKEFVEETASSSPAPGGGSVSALAGSLGAGLLNMALNLTLGKEKYASVQELLAPLLSQTTALHQRLIELVDTDTAAFNSVMAAFKLPKETEEEKASRTASIQAAYRHSAEVPLQVAGLCLEVLRLVQPILENCNPGALSDAGSAVQMAYAGMEGAVLNVKINIIDLKDREFADEARQRADTMLVEGAALRDRAGAYLKGVL
ncbi:MAG TPA: cyclodeaminase/cyclohydrolase family protein [Patescibacteria group bacterium]|nr:cyclodeaminase/cyclohydrolase family protein [Patescibacteria group bacterium]